MFIRVFVVALTVATLWWSSSSFGLGLGLGELNVNSNLASPLKASVTLRGMDGIDLDPEFFSIRIDSDSRSKIEYRLQRMDADTAVIDLYTREIISDPLFQFRIEVKWDNNAVSRNYDVLVDPPVYQEFLRADEDSETGEANIADAEQTGEQNDLKVQKPIALSDVELGDVELGDVESGDVVPAETAATERPAGESTGNTVGSDTIEPGREYGPTINGNSIWRVARAVATDNGELTIYQWMYAIWNANPQAFSRDNMHRLNMHEVLSIPLEDEVSATTHLSAWRAYSKQMSMLSVSVPATDTMTLDATGESEQLNVPPIVMAHEVVAQQAGQKIDTEVTLVDDNALPAEKEFEVLAEDTLIAVLEKSASRIDEESVVATPQEIVLVTPDTEVETLQSVSVDDPIDTPMIEVSQLDESATPGDISNENRVVPDPLDAVAADNQLSTNAVQEEVTAATTSMPVNTSDPKLDGWPAALLSRHEFIDQLPVIGVGGALAFVGRAVQSVDRYIATRSSWATLVFGAGITLALMMLSRELRARRTTTGTTGLPIASSTTKVLASLARRRKSAARSADQAAPQSANGERPESASEVRQESISDELQGSAGEELQDATDRTLPNLVRQDSEATSNAPEILAQANSILSQGDIEEAIKLMRVAVELQPDQPTLVMLLLDLYHKTRRAVFFAELLDRSRSVLESLEDSDQVRLRAMHAQLCPDLAFEFGLDESTDNGDLLAGDSSEWSSITDPELDLDSLPQLDTVDEVEASAPDVKSEFSNEVQQDDTPLLDDTATTSSDDSDYPHIDDGPDDEAYLETQVIFTNNGVPLQDEVTSMPNMVGENFDLDVTLKEVDVYLAYGLYDNAEELLLKGMAADPDRADFLARLLDSYFATRNIIDFVSCAEVMQDMGDAGSEYWEKVEIMGFQLAPYNQLFAGGKDGKLEAAELEIARPQTADFDLSDIADNNNSGLTDIEIEESSKTALADIELYENEGDDFTSTDLNLDMEADELGNSVDDDIDDLDSDLEQLLNSEVSGLADNLADSEDEPVIDLEATDDDLDAILSESLIATEDELEEVRALEIQDDDDEINLDCEEEDGMQFTMDDDIEPGQNTMADGDDASLVLVEEPTLDSLTNVKLDSDNSRILYFPDSPTEGRNIDEFESEVKFTLQSIRDQLQNMTERLFHQERATHDLKQTLAEVKDDSSSSKGKKGKKSS